MGRINFIKHDKSKLGQIQSAGINLSTSDWKFMDGTATALVDNASVTDCNDKKCMFKKGSKLELKVDLTDPNEPLEYFKFDNNDLISID